MSDSRPRQDLVGEAIEAVYREHHNSLLRFAWLLTGRREDAEDVVHGTFLRFAQVEPEPTNPGAYLRTMVMNAIKDLRRERGRYSPAPLPDLPQFSPESQELWDVLRVLSDDQREVIVLRYHDDLTQEEIAQVLDCPIGTVRTRISRGLSRLRKAYHDSN